MSELSSTCNSGESEPNYQITGAEKTFDVFIDFLRDGGGSARFYSPSTIGFRSDKQVAITTLRFQSPTRNFTIHFGAEEAILDYFNL